MHGHSSSLSWKSKVPLRRGQPWMSLKMHHTRECDPSIQPGHTSCRMLTQANSVWPVALQIEFCHSKPPTRRFSLCSLGVSHTPPPHQQMLIIRQGDMMLWRRDNRSFHSTTLLLIRLMHTKSMASDLPVVELLQAFIRYASGGDSSDAGFSCVLDFLVFSFPTILGVWE